MYQKFETNVTLKCIVSGYPQPDITWYKDDQIIEGIKTQTYFIEELTLDSRGVYKCAASNELGNVSSMNIYVKIRGIVITNTLYLHFPGLVQYKVELNFTKQFLQQEIVTPDVRRQVDETFASTDERLNKILTIVKKIFTKFREYILSQLNTHIKSQLSNNNTRFFDMQLVPTNITLV